MPQEYRRRLRAARTGPRRPELETVERQLAKPQSGVGRLIDSQELKQEIGLGHYEGRGWRGFHHHAGLCIAAYGFLVAERCLFPPQARFTRQRLAAPTLPESFRPRGARPA